MPQSNFFEGCPKRCTVILRIPTPMIGLLIYHSFSIFAAPKHGEMSEWLKEHAWKACLPQKGNVGSNPTLSAE